MSNKWIEYKSQSSGLQRLVAIDKIIWVEFLEVESGCHIVIHFSHDDGGLCITGDDALKIWNQLKGEGCNP